MYIVNFKDSACTFGCAAGDTACETLAIDNCREIKQFVNVDPNDKTLYACLLTGLFVMYRVGGLWLLRRKAETVY